MQTLLRSSIYYVGNRHCFPMLGLILGLAIQLSRIEGGHFMVVVLNHRFLKRHVGEID